MGCRYSSNPVPSLLSLLLMATVQRFQPDSVSVTLSISAPLPLPLSVPPSQTAMHLMDVVVRCTSMHIMDPHSMSSLPLSLTVHANSLQSNPIIHLHLLPPPLYLPFSMAVVFISKLSIQNFSCNVSGGVGRLPLVNLLRMPRISGLGMFGVDMKCLSLATSSQKPVRLSISELPPPLLLLPLSLASHSHSPSLFFTPPLLPSPITPPPPLHHLLLSAVPLPLHPAPPFMMDSSASTKLQLSSSSPAHTKPSLKGVRSVGISSTP